MTKGIMINNMSPLDCICLINDVRLGGRFVESPITVEDWNTQIENAKLELIIQLPFNQDKCVECPLLKLFNDNGEVAALLTEKMSRSRSPVINKPLEEIPPVNRLIPSQVTTGIPNRPISGEEDGNMGQAWQKPLEKPLEEQGGGTRKRKKKKRRRRKTKRNHKRRKNKHSRKRKRKRRRKRKTRRN